MDFLFSVEHLLADHPKTQPGISLD